MHTAYNTYVTDGLRVKCTALYWSEVGRVQVHVVISSAMNCIKPKTFLYFGLKTLQN